MYGSQQEDKDKIFTQLDEAKLTLAKEKEIHSALLNSMKDKLEKESTERAKLDGEIYILKQEVKKQAEIRLREVEQAVSEQKKVLEDKDLKIHNKQIELDRADREKERLKHELDQKERLITSSKHEITDIRQKLKETNDKITE